MVHTDHIGKETRERKAQAISVVIECKIYRIDETGQRNGFGSNKRRLGLRKDKKTSLIRINDQWRICFEWHQNESFKVEIIDYH
jgi:plasmid maintenance system killer protein